MQIAFVVVNISFCLILTVFGRPEELKYEEIKTNHHPDPNSIEQFIENNLDDITRKKKSTVTTFCVEIRPADEKPYQVCEPVTDKGSYNNPAPYFPQNGGFEHAKPEVSFNSGSSVQNKPAAAYSAPIKTFQSSGSGTASKPAYGAYRSTKPEREDEPEKVNPAKVSQPETMTESTNIEDKTSEVPQTSSKFLASRNNQESEEEAEDFDSMRAAHHQDFYKYGSGYGKPTSLIPQHGHSGLVITCQPNLAGYAHSVPGAFHESEHHGGAPLYNYRSANPSYGRPYQPYRPQPQAYGNYKPYSTSPVYRPQAQIYKGPIYSNPFPHSAGVNVPSPHAYKPPVGTESHEAPIPAPHPIPNDFSAYQTLLPPAPLSPPPSQFQPIPHSSYSPHSTFSLPASYYPPPPSPGVPASEYKPAYTPPGDYKPPVYAPAYVPPPAYRQAEEENVGIKAEPVEAKSDKEVHTLETMSKISQKNIENSRWVSETQSSRNNEAADTLAIPHGGWREAETVKAAGNWRSAEEGAEMRDASFAKNKEERVVQNWDHPAIGNFRNADKTNGGIDNEESIENKIEENL